MLKAFPSVKKNGVSSFFFSPTLKRTDTIFSFALIPLSLITARTLSPGMWVLVKEKWCQLNAIRLSRNVFHRLWLCQSWQAGGLLQ
jgi:hypothetical protein